MTKVSSEEEATPIIRIGEGRRKGEGKPRCPYCWEKRCFRESLGLHAESGIKLGGRYIRYSRLIGKCFNPKYDNSYFMIEYRLDYKLLDKMLRRKQCPFCKGDNAAVLLDRTNEAKFDTFFGKPTPPDFKKMLLETRTFMRNYEYHCKACKLKVSFDINLNWVNKKNRWLYETLSSLSEQNQIL